MVLVLLWCAATAVLVLWGVLARPGSATLLPVGGRLTLATQPPSQPVLSVWVRWDAPRGRDGWIVLEPGEPWPAAAEPYWRRRVLPGWNLLTWSAASWLPADRPVTLRVIEGAPRAWAAAGPRTAARYDAEHVVSLRGLLLALLLGALAAAAALASWLRSGWRWRAWGLVLGAIALLALALRLRTLTSQSLWFDEVLTAIGSQSLDWVLYTPQVFGHPPLQYVAGWIVGGGASDGWLRAPFVLAGACTVLVLGWLGRRLFDPVTGVVAALALSLSPFHVELSQIARPYALLLLLATVSVIALLTAIRDARADAWVLFSATTALAVYTHYLGLTLVAAEALIAGLLLAGRRWQGTGAALISFAAVGVLLAPWAPVLARLGAAEVGQGELPSPALHQLLVNVFVPQFLGPAPATAVGLLLVARGLAACRRNLRAAAVLALWLAVPVVLVWLAQPRHWVAGRHLALLLLPLMLLLGRGVTALGHDVRWTVLGMRRGGRWRARLAGAMAAATLLAAWALPVAAGLRGYYGTRQGFDWRTVAAVLDTVVPARDPVVATVGAAYPLRHYWRPDVRVLAAGDLAARLAGPAPGPVWVVVHLGWDRPDGLDAWLEARAVPVAEVPPSWSQPGVRVWRLRSASRPPTSR